jgi:hypothetical protein
MKKDTKITIGVGIALIVLVVVLGLIGRNQGGANPGSNPGSDYANAKPSVYDNFAQCLAVKKVTMYGAYWCSHCHNQKSLFGDAFRYVPYVECTQDIKKCTDMGIEGYPTWIFADGSRVGNEMTLEELAGKAGCELPSLR